MVVAPGAGTGLNGEVYKELGYLDWNTKPPGNDHRCPPKIPQNCWLFFEDDFYLFSRWDMCYIVPCRVELNVFIFFSHRFFCEI